MTLGRTEVATGGSDAPARSRETAMVETTINYVAKLAERPYYYTYEPPAGTPWRNTKGDRRTVAIADARGLASPSLDREGFALVAQASAVVDFDDPRAIREVYFPEVEALVVRVAGARRVVAFDYNRRSSAKGERHGKGIREPVRYAHNDYTEKSGPQRVRDLLPGEADRLLAGRFAVVNVWRPTRGAVEQAPLAVCDARSIAADDLLETDLVYEDRKGEVYSLRYAPAHRWFYYPRQRADEVLLLKCYDSARDRARFTAHSAFDDPTSPPDAAPRESIEVRTLAFF
jgi:hypothetical protein